MGIILKARKKLHKAALVTLYYSFAYPYLIYCNLVWGNTYSTNLEKINRLQKKLVRIITNSPYRAHTAPLLLANRLLSVAEINSYIVGIFMYNSINGILPSTFSDYFVSNRDAHQCNTRQADDLRVPFRRLYVRKFSIKIHGAQVWNSLPQYIRSASAINDFKKKLRNFLIDKNIHIAVTQY